MPTLNLCTHAPRLSKHRAKAGAVHARACTGVGSVCAWQLRVRVCPCRTGVVGGGCWWLLSDAEVTSLQILLTRICLRCAGLLNDARGQVTRISPRSAQPSTHHHRMRKMWQDLPAVRARGRQLSPRSPCFTRARVVDWCAGNTLTEVQEQIGGCGGGSRLQASTININTKWASASGSQPMTSRNHTAM